MFRPVLGCAILVTACGGEAAETVTAPPASSSRAAQNAASPAPASAPPITTLTDHAITTSFSCTPSGDLPPTLTVEVGDTTVIGTPVIIHWDATNLPLGASVGYYVQARDEVVGCTGGAQCVYELPARFAALNLKTDDVCEGSIMATTTWNAPAIDCASGATCPPLAPREYSLRVDVYAQPSFTPDTSHVDASGNEVVDPNGPQPLLTAQSAPFELAAP